MAELLAACERGRAAGDRGVDAALCEWYAVPCDCKGRAPATGPRWCVPAAESIDAALPKVLAALRAAPQQQAPALEVVPGIMARLYPCAAATTP
ncbi:Rap1a/Tai family immunity protein [uncultured Thiohalocapsa sp.]|uniref:Rap1a/Tai family immunity protein n=1 Tax=uncultured Thiohalocapsa sp. TaxID=768990 RepID=UPI0025D648E7|nr:Rap1a/Tai family immunity protein [uncultured Thiohalocapsa sp.]